jgi:hypothetical protein
LMHSLFVHPTTIATHSKKHEYLIVTLLRYSQTKTPAPQWDRRL